ncbi:hypothetical protein TWF788_004358 [Orbilia oligospora]|uniref:Major facilitator superfamily (MFS) profile domain-containing protein n=1 Tax=Orbilia oligospora TaxID=2813651 RepID=A0A6G1M5C7_ORBOL|nr:hypothetical protein TWF788_004358 [Orbilia oligospora]KAF3202106.1 hypothetical protein TWF679_011089 [Orbilia oligospora]KAF3225000.1 hypothetical protein TWF191_005848 [Orbilia oligospora]KAF3245809.1 hypothetical protein TWF192_007285 [Orbilia oligospora]
MATNSTQSHREAQASPDPDVKLGLADEAARSIIATNFGNVEDDGVLEEGSLDPRYRAKATILNAAMQDMGFGAYQKFLFCVCGFGWFIDNMWPQVTAIILSSVQREFKFKPPSLLALSQNIGLLVGAAVWGLASDVIGRRWAFNLTLLVVGVFGLIAGASPNFEALAVFAALWSFGVGGSLPVDSAIFLEFINGKSQWTLTLLSIWWAGGQIVASLVAWPLIGNYGCPDADTCTKENNWGWRYFVFAMGGLTLLLFIIRFFIFNMYESPKYLMGKARDADAVDVVHKVAEYNKFESSLSLDHLEAVDRQYRSSESDNGDRPQLEDYTTASAALRRNLEKFKFDHIRALFRTRQLAYSTSLIILLWGIIGLAFPLYNAFLPFLLTNRGAELGEDSLSTTYRNYVIIGVCGIPGSLLATAAVELPRLGRKGAMCIATVLTGVFLFLSTTAKTSSALLGWNCGYSVTSNAMYGILYAYTPEIFPTSSRGTGNALAACANRVFGIMAPVIAGYADLTTSVPVYVSGALFIAAGGVMLLLPYEPRGKASM